MDALETIQLSVNYEKTPALWDINVKIPQGQLIGIIGPNGAGKSTFLKGILEILPKLTGKVLFFGELLDKVRSKVAYVPQRNAVDWDFPIVAKDLVLMGCYGKLGLFRRPSAADRAFAVHCLERVGMAHHAHRQISQLSGGQQQRIFLARALMQQAQIYFLDEPFAGIDVGSEQTLIQVLRELRQSGKTVFIVHHDLSTVESYFDSVMILNIRLIACGPTGSVFTPENLNMAYGKSYALFDEALHLSQQRAFGEKL